MGDLRDKLKKYYGLTDGISVYPNAIILQPRGKLGLFRKLNFEQFGPDFTAEAYSKRLRAAFVEEYESREFRPSPSPSFPAKRPHSAIDDTDPLELALADLAESDSINEYDRYISQERVKEKIPVLDWWRQHWDEYPQLSLMVRDTFAVPATGAGVERQFSHSGRVVTSLRNRLSPETIKDVMMFKSHLEGLSTNQLASGEMRV